MAQATNAMNTVNGQVEISLDAEASFDDISGFANKLVIGELQRQVDDTFTAEGDTGIVKAGKFNPVDITYTVLYTEGASDIFTEIYAAYKAKTEVTVRWSPGGGNTGDYQFQSDPGPITSCNLPGVDPDEAGALLLTFTVRVPGIDAPTTIA